MSEQEMNIQFDMPKNRSNVIKVIGVGGGGSNAINHMFEQGINGVDFVVSNTDSQALQNSPVPTKIQLGVNLTEGLGAGANPEIGEQAALESFEDLKTLLDSHTKMVFITAGMGGGTGTGAAPIIAKQARDMEILSVGIVTIPFKFEGRMRNEQAQKGVEKLRRNVDSLIVIDNNKLREVYGNLGFKSGFSKADEVLATAARGIAEVITHHYTQNIDLRDAKTVLSNSGTAIMGSAKATGGDRAQEAIEKALDSPLLNDNKIAGAQNVLLLIVSGTEEITLDEIGEINDHIQDEAGHGANIIMGVGEDEDLGEAVAVTIIATGFNPEQQNEIINTESKKIIHTLGDEQKAVQDLSPESGKANHRRKREPQPEEKKIVHSLGEEEEPSLQDTDDAMKLIPTSTLIRELEVDYKEVKYDEDDFVFINTADEEEQKKETETQKEEKNPFEEPLLKFDLEASESTPEEKENATSQASSQSDQSTSTRQERTAKARSIEVEEGIELIPGGNAENGGKRYSLEDYMEKERELEAAQPHASHRSQPREDRSVSKKNLDSSAGKTTNPATPKEEREEIDPLNSPISEELASRASERRARLKKFNYKFKNNSNIDEIEKQPAYKRAGVDLDNAATNKSDQGLSRSSLENEEGAGEPHFRSNNSYLHDNVD